MELGPVAGVAEGKEFLGEGLYKTDPIGYTLLADKGLENLTFELVIDNYPTKFSNDAVHKARERLSEFKTY